MCALKLRGNASIIKPDNFSGSKSFFPKNIIFTNPTKFNKDEGRPLGLFKRMMRMIREALLWQAVLDTAMNFRHFRVILVLYEHQLPNFAIYNSAKGPFYNGIR